MTRWLLLAPGALLATPAFADAVAGQTRQQPTNWTAIAMFAAFALLTPPVGLRPPYAASSAKTAPSINHPTSQQGGPFCAPIGGPD